MVVLLWIIGLVIWWNIGFWTFVYAWTLKNDVDSDDLFFAVAVAMMGIITALMMLFIEILPFWIKERSNGDVFFKKQVRPKEKMERLKK